MNQLSKSRLPISALVISSFLLCAFPADAHLNSTGLGPFYDGTLHFLLSPEDIIPVFALALLVGLRGAVFGRRTLFVLPAAWLVGGFLGLRVVATLGNSMLAPAWFLLLGGLLALDAKVSLRTTTALAGVSGVYHGYLNGAGISDTPWTGFVALLGLTFAIYVLIALAAAFVVQLGAEWARIGVRVIGSWIVASGLLMIGWAVRTK